MREIRVREIRVRWWVPFIGILLAWALAFLPYLLSGE